MPRRDRPQRGHVRHGGGGYGPPIPRRGRGTPIPPVHRGMDRRGGGNLDRRIVGSERGRSLSTRQGGGWAPAWYLYFFLPFQFLTVPVSFSYYNQTYIISFFEGIIKDLNSLVGTKVVTGRAVNLRVVGVNRTTGEDLSNGVVTGGVTAKAPTLKAAVAAVAAAAITIRVMAMETAIVGISSIIISIGANSSRVDRQQQHLADRLRTNNNPPRYVRRVE